VVGDADRPAGTFVVAWFTERDTDAIANTTRVILAVAGTALLVTTALGWWLAGRVLRPVQEVTDTARRITDADLSRRIPVQGDDELAHLGTTFNAMLDRLESGFANQRRFLNDVAHELRTPITIARGHLELLGDDPAERAETVGVVTEELDRMSRYVDDLLVLAKAEQPDFLATRPVDVGELALDWRARVEALGERTWRLDAAPEPGAVICTADPDRLTQAVLALTTNAVQHTGAGDEIGIGVDGGGPDGGCRIWVRDTGPGVAHDQREHIFERAARAPGSRDDRPEGTGLGLAIVAAIAHAHGGRARVVATPGGGATFVLHLPTRPAGATPAEAM
jgi:signal transduction histidine kinase